MTEPELNPEFLASPSRVTESVPQATTDPALARTLLRIDPVPGKTSLRVLSLVGERPGITIQQVAVALGISHPTACYHLQRLVRDREVSRVLDGRDVRFFPAGGYSITSHVRVIVSDPAKRDVLVFLRQRMGVVSTMTLNEMARALDLRFGFLKRTLLQLERIGLVYLERRGARYLVWPVEAALLRPDIGNLVGGLRDLERGPVPESPAIATSRSGDP